MEYKEKYEAMFNRLNNLLDDCKKKGHIVVRVEDIESIFPELNEDERIREALIEHFSWNTEQILNEFSNKKNTYLARKER